MERKVTTLAMDKQLHTRLIIRARASRRTMADIVNQLLRDWLGELTPEEDAYLKQVQSSNGQAEK